MSANPANLNNSTNSNNSIRLLYYGQTAMDIRGAVSGLVYRFSRATPSVAVDVRDAASMLRTRLFRQVR